VKSFSQNQPSSLATRLAHLFIPSGLGACLAYAKAALALPFVFTGYVKGQDPPSGPQNFLAGTPGYFPWLLHPGREEGGWVFPGREEGVFPGDVFLGLGADVFGELFRRADHLGFAARAVYVGPPTNILRPVFGLVVHINRYLLIRFFFFSSEKEIQKF
jgi:hypothetical protein